MDVRELKRVQGDWNRRTRRFLQSFLRERQDGAVAIIYALSLIPLSLLTLTAVDFHRASAVRQALQDSLDAAALAVARSSATSDADVQALGQKVLMANLEPLTNAKLNSFTFKPGTDGRIVATATVGVKPIITNLFTGGDLTVSASSETVRANYKLEVALVLDNTGSMASNNKIGILKDAATDLVDTLAAGASRSVEPDAVKLALVPFSFTVRVDPSYRTAAWMNQTSTQTGNDQLFDTSSAERFALYNTMGISWKGCLEGRPIKNAAGQTKDYDISDAGADPSQPASMFVPYFAPDEPDKGDYSDWNDNYATDNNYLDDGLTANSANKDWFKRQKRVAKYKSSGLSLSGDKGPNRGCGMQQIVRLTTSYSTIKTAISNMTAVGNTNIPLGMAWGWHALSPNSPFADGKPYGTPKTKKIAILMTDGENVNGDASNPNDSVYAGVGYIWQGRLGITSGTQTQRRTAMDNRLKALCSNMKAKGVEIYTVGVQVDSGTVTMLRNCATAPDHAFDVKNVNDIHTAFDAIAGSISNLRIAK